MFLGLLDPDPLVRGMDPDPTLSRSQNNKKNLDFYCFVTSFSLFIYGNDGNAVLLIRNKSVGSEFGSGTGLQLVLIPDADPNPDSNPVTNPGFGSGSASWIWIRIRNCLKLPLFLLKFLRSFIFKYKKSTIPQLRINFICVWGSPPPPPCRESLSAP